MRLHEVWVFFHHLSLESTEAVWTSRVLCIWHHILFHGSSIVPANEKRIWVSINNVDCEILQGSIVLKSLVVLRHLAYKGSTCIHEM